MTDPLIEIWEEWHDPPCEPGVPIPESWVEYEVTGSCAGYSPYIWKPTTLTWDQNDITETIAKLRDRKRLDNMMVRRRTVVATEWETIE